MKKEVGGLWSLCPGEVEVWEEEEVLTMGRDGQAELVWTQAAL